MNKLKNLLSLFGMALALCLVFTQKVHAITINPTGTFFGVYGPPTYGGTGINNGTNQVTQAGNLTLSMSATPRFDNPALTNNGAGTFNALPGGDGAHGQPGWAMWNFNFYVSGVANGQNTRLYYDLNGAIGNDVSTFINFGSANGQDSWNLGMNFLGGAGFNPNLTGVSYDFALVTYNSDGSEYARSAIQVNVGPSNTNGAPDGGSTAALAALGLLGLLAIKSRLGSLITA